jgi:glycosyltransferase involved in cell wall biosynthesis
MVGTDMNAKGGISSVIKMYQEAGLFEKVRFMPSYTEGSPLRKLVHYLSFLFQYLGILLTQPSVRVVHVHTAGYGSFFRKSWVLLLAKLFGKKSILHMHGAGFVVFYGKMPALYQRFIRLTFQSADMILALSSQWKEDLYRIYNHSDIRVLYNPTILREPILDGRQGESSDEPVRFLFMGRLGQRKGVYDIIKSATKLQKANVEIQLYGDGEIEEIKKQVSANGVADKVTVCGWIDGSRKDETFRNANVLLLPSYHEGLPISVLEAMAYGLPVLATDVGGISEAVYDGVNGYLIQPGECEKLAERIEWLAASPQLRREMGKTGYEMASGKFALPVIMRQLEELYADLIKC